MFWSFCQFLSLVRSRTFDSRRLPSPPGPSIHFRSLAYASGGRLVLSAIVTFFVILERLRVDGHICPLWFVITSPAFCPERHLALWFLLHRWSWLFWLLRGGPKDTLYFWLRTPQFSSSFFLPIPEFQLPCHSSISVSHFNRTRLIFLWVCDTVNWICRVFAFFLLQLGRRCPFWLVWGCFRIGRSSLSGTRFWGFRISIRFFGSIAC